jgi:hypothetical protein
MRAALVVTLLSGCVAIRERTEDAPVAEAPVLTCFREGVCKTEVSLGADASCPVYAMAFDDQTCLVRGGPIQRRHAAPIDDDSESQRIVPCGAETGVCESKLRCDCTKTHPRSPCEAFAKQRALVLRHRNKDTCEAVLQRPNLGSCELRVGARVGRQVDKASGSIDVGEVATLCGVQVRCGCESFAPVTGSTGACLVLGQVETESGGCSVEYEQCVGAQCTSKSEALERNAPPKTICGAKFSCPPPPVEL